VVSDLVWWDTDGSNRTRTAWTVTVNALVMSVSCGASGDRPDAGGVRPAVGDDRFGVGDSSALVDSGRREPQVHRLIKLALGPTSQLVTIWQSRDTLQT